MTFQLSSIDNGLHHWRDAPMTPVEMFEKALDAWGVEVASPVDELQLKRVLMHEGKPLGVVWSPEVALDLAAFHGQEVADKMIMILLNLTARAITGMDPEEEDDGLETQTEKQD
jgi:hypothetical protein